MTLHMVEMGGILSLGSQTLTLCTGCLILVTGGMIEERLSEKLLIHLATLT